MSAETNSIENAELIESIFGKWPSFHDAEVHRIELTRDCEPPRPWLIVAIHHWEMTRDVDSAGYFVTRRHTLSTLRFTGVQELILSGFNHQNVLSELEISELSESTSDAKFVVNMFSSFGCEVSFKCKGIGVLSAVPYIKSR